jgi:hypothetical protein
LVSIACFDRRKQWHTVSGNLEEIAERRAVVLTGIPIEPRTKVRIRCEISQLKGTVKSCTEDPAGFLVEVRLDPESRWFERWFTLQHLLRLNFKARKQRPPAPKGCGGTLLSVQLLKSRQRCARCEFRSDSGFSLRKPLGY